MVTKDQAGRYAMLVIYQAELERVRCGSLQKEGLVDEIRSIANEKGLGDLMPGFLPYLKIMMKRDLGE